jgi:murein L,D-transpeptidase YcbB/YkuD
MLFSRKTLRQTQILLFFFLFSLWGAAGVSAQGASSAAYPYAQITQLIKKRIERYRSQPPGPPDNEKIYALESVEDFYKDRNYAPAWFGDKGFADVASMARAIRYSAADGLTPEYYHLRTIADLLGKAYAIYEPGTYVDPGILVDLDLLLTDSFFTLAHHLSQGCVNQATFQPEWSIPGASEDISEVLTTALEKHRVGEALRTFAPHTPEYASLSKALSRYRKMAKHNNLQIIPEGRLLKKGMRSERVPELRNKLALFGDLEKSSTATGDFFDAPLKQAVARFQQSHGLRPDGIVGSSTLQELNTPIEQRILQIMVNMERMRWSNGGRADRYLIVNIARFELEVVDKGNVVLSMKVVVGKPFLDTPVFKRKMTYLVLDPVWNIPESIAKEEILPKIKKDRNYLKKENITVLRGWGDKEEEVDPQSVKWKSVTPLNLYFRFRQGPGPRNPLGRIKFMFPNRYNVYLHDTPAKNLFSQDVRTFSHGCIRIEKPLELAEYVLKGDPRWTKDGIEAAIKKGSTREVRLPRPLDVYVVYVTAWVDKDGSAEFRDDVYGRDAVLYDALVQNPAQPHPFGDPPAMSATGSKTLQRASRDKM